MGEEGDGVSVGVLVLDVDVDVDVMRGGRKGLLVGGR